MTISLIIPVFNQLQLLNKCLHSVMAQTLKPDEIVFSDDGSGDDVRDFVEGWKAKLQYPLSLVRQEHKGFRAARVRNNAALAAKGELLVFLDQDIIIPPNYLQSIAEASHNKRFLTANCIRLNQGQTEAITRHLITAGPYINGLEAKQTTDYYKANHKDQRDYIIYKYTRLNNHGAKLRAGLCAIRATDFKAVNGFDEEFYDCPGEDDDLGRRLLAYGIIGYNCCKDVPILHLWHPAYQRNVDNNRESYRKQRKKEISAKNYLCAKGLNSPRPDVTHCQL